MLLPLAGRRLYYDLVGPEEGPLVCITHSLASDGGMWAEQMPPLLQAGFRVLRIDMRGHGGSDPVAGDYTMTALSGDVAAVLEALAIPRVHYIGLSIGGMIGQALAIEHGAKLISALWSDTLPASPAGAAAAWDERMSTVRRANSLEPLADSTMERWFTDAFKPRKPGRWKEIRDTVAATTPAGYLGCSAAIMNFDFTGQLRRSAFRLLSCAAPTIRARRRPKTGGSPVWFPAGATRRSPKPAISPMSSTPRHSTGS
ncbi:MAG TPA: alpha/beta hydrolase [Stellaceae bacterium]|nr:alpha/beta hydrolase [Stellaceae bacterium]